MKPSRDLLFVVLARDVVTELGYGQRCSMCVKRIEVTLAWEVT
jgi:hypothetical protein